MFHVKQLGRSFMAILLAAPAMLHPAVTKIPVMYSGTGRVSPSWMRSLRIYAVKYVKFN